MHFVCHHSSLSLSIVGRVNRHFNTNNFSCPHIIRDTLNFDKPFVDDVIVPEVRQDLSNVRSTTFARIYFMTIHRYAGGLTYERNL